MPEAGDGSRATGVAEARRAKATVRRVALQNMVATEVLKRNPEEIVEAWRAGEDLLSIPVGLLGSYTQVRTSTLTSREASSDAPSWLWEQYTWQATGFRDDCRRLGASDPHLPMTVASESGLTDRCNDRPARFGGESTLSAHCNAADTTQVARVS